MFDPYLKDALADVRSVVKAAARRIATESGRGADTPTLFDDAAKHPSLAETLSLRPLHVFIADDVCTSAGWVLDPEFVRDNLVPTYARLAAEVVRSGTAAGLADTVVGFHSDGDIGELYPDLAAAGFGAVHLASVDYHEVTRLAGSASAAGMVAFGGVASETLGGGEVADEVCRLLARTAASDGLVVTDDAGVTNGDELDVLARAYGRVGLY